MKKSFIVVLGVLLFTATSLCACKNEQGNNAIIKLDNEENSDLQYTLAVVKKGTVSSEVMITCAYSPKEKLACSFNGDRKEIKEILVEKGDLVTKGQVLARQDVDEYDQLILDEQHNVEMAKLDLAHAQEMKKIELDMLDQEYNYVEKEKRDYVTYNQQKKRITKDYDTKIIDLNDQITIHTMKKEEYADKMEEGTLRAPEDGVVTLSRSNMVGMYSKPGEAVVSIIRNNDLTFISNEMDKAKYVKEGSTYQIVVGKGESSKKIDVIASDMKNWKDQMFFEIQVPDLKLETGTKGELWIKLDEKNNVLYVPNEAVHQTGDKSYVYTITEEGMRNIQYVTVGIAGKENTEIEKGLNEGQSVILN